MSDLIPFVMLSIAVIALTLTNLMQTRWISRINRRVLELEYPHAAERRWRGCDVSPEQRSNAPTQ